MDKIKVHLPGLITQYRTNSMLLRLMYEHPECFRQDVEIASVYGCFPGQVWNGGRFLRANSDKPTKFQVAELINSYNDAGIGVNLTYTNSTLLPADLADDFCNTITEIAESSMNGVIVVSNLLENYIRRTYPELKVLASTIKEYRTLEELNAACDIYDAIVPSYNANHDWDVLSKVKNPEKIVMLVNEFCIPNCPYRTQHYNFVSDCIRKGKSKKSPFDCQISHNFYESYDSKNFVKVDEVFGPLRDMGINQIKIMGRAAMHPKDLIEAYTYYLALPEAQDFVREMLLYYVLPRIGCIYPLSYKSPEDY